MASSSNVVSKERGGIGGGGSGLELSGSELTEVGIGAPSTVVVPSVCTG